MRRIKFPLTRPYTTSQEAGGVKQVLESGWLTQGNCATELEKRIRRYNNIKYACLVNSATSGLIACIRSLGLHKGDEVIVPSFAFPAVANAVVLADAKPVFCDIDLDTFNISADRVEALVTKKTKAVIVVHEFGLSADMEAILKIAKRHRLHVIEDAACSLGAEYNGKKTGTFGDLGVFSFHPRKLVTCGEGGCVVTNSNASAKRIDILRNHGEFNKRFVDIGYNFRLSDIQASVLLSQFNRIEAVIAKRIRLADNYGKLLKVLSDNGILKAPPAPKNCRHIYQSYVVLFSKRINRDKVKSALRQKGIETQIGTYCIPMLDFYRGNFSISGISYKNAKHAYKKSLALPLYHALDAGSQETVIKELKKVLKRCAA